MRMCGCDGVGVSESAKVGMCECEWEGVDVSAGMSACCGLACRFVIRCMHVWMPQEVIGKCAQTLLLSAKHSVNALSCDTISQ